ncbi:probable tRNA(His) guanylyltransferase isoform X2 [Pectinophora gossypiella]|uniref:probable tRNA(His) guanylyltransferase isoform X2 n=1 Tax=Pectinophora gossypiella TaxID=13191 RepID=UPI00214EBDA2|nr:probable tRNA(His) guanylyltransferase isoform X2 [Pectinophora gossypiella]
MSNVGKLLQFKRYCEILTQNSITYYKIQKMAKSSFEYVKNFESDDTLLPNTWIVVRLDDEKLKYPPTFDGRVVLYPTEENLIDYMKWRQADVHINNLYNTTFWALVLKANLSPTQAEKRLCGTVSADKNEILFKEFNINYNNEAEMFKRGTLLLKKTISVDSLQKTVIVDVHDDMLKDKFWTNHSSLLVLKPSKQKLLYEGPITNIIQEQINSKENNAISNQS